MSSKDSNLVYQLLKKYWSYDEFRPLQFPIINAVLERNDVLAVLPTGGGKSLCYQLPALILQGITIVISPLIALMEDQVSNLTEKGIAAVMINSGQSLSERMEIYNAIKDGLVKIVYCAPERLLNDEFLNLCSEIFIELLVIDEAHCISQWGHDFRPTYRRIKDFLEVINIPIKIALTASATKEVRDDILVQAAIEHAKVFTQASFRPNISYKAIFSNAKLADFKNIFSENSGSGILYCPTRKSTEQSAQWLRSFHIKSLSYHAGMSNKERKYAQETWLKSQETIICATNAFGMGIDKADVRKVVHLQAPASLEAYYQEAGRAGRDGKMSEAIVYWNEQDITNLQNNTELNFPSYDYITTVYENVMNKLQIGFGEGFENKYYLDLPSFCQDFKMPIMPTLSTLKLIEISELWVWNQDDSTKHKVVFTSNRNDLESLENINYEAYEIAVSLLRLYGGIYKHLTTIDPSLIGKTIGKSYEKIIAYLHDLHRLDIIEYSPAQYGSSLYLLHNRMQKQHLRLDKKKIEMLKKMHQLKVKSITNYLINDSTCRSKIIGAYFDDEQTRECGICDNCLKKNKIPITATEKKAVYNFLKKNNNIDFSNLSLHFSNISTDVLWSILNTFATENWIAIKGENITFNQK